MIKKRALIICGICLAVCAVAGGIAGIVHFHNTKITINDKVYARTVTQLDLSGVAQPELDKVRQLTKLTALNLKNTGITAGQYDEIKKSLPGCEILWSVPFQEGHWDSDATELTVSALSPEDLKQLDYFTALTRVDAGLCTDYEQLAALVKTRPEIAVEYSIPLLGGPVSGTATELTVQGEHAWELTDGLKLMPKMQNVRIEGQLPGAAFLNMLCKQYPDIKFYWEYTIYGVTANVDTQELELSEIKMDSVEQVENALPYLPNLKKVIMCDCGISNSEMDALGKRNPQVRFIWTVWVSHYKLRTDVKTFMPAATRSGFPTNEGCYNLRYCVDMEAIDLGHMEKLESIEFVRYMPNIQYLLLGDTGISDLSPLANKDKLVYLEIFRCFNIYDVSPLVTLKNLEDMNLCYVWCDRKIIAQMTWLNNLWFSHGPISDFMNKENQTYMAQMLPDTHLELDCFSSTGEGWRELPNYYAQRDLFGMPYNIG